MSRARALKENGQMVREILLLSPTFDDVDVGARKELVVGAPFGRLTQQPDRAVGTLQLLRERDRLGISPEKAPMCPTCVAPLLRSLKSRFLTSRRPR